MYDIHYIINNSVGYMILCTVGRCDHRLYFRLILLVSLLFLINMASSESVKLFTFIKKTFRIIGISPPQSNQKHNSINSKNWIFLLCLVQLCIATVGYFFTEANSIMEYGMVFFNAITAIETIILYLIFIWQMKNILNYIENCEKFVEKSK